VLTATIITLVILTGLGSSVRPGRRTIAHRPYNNHYNDASGARDGRLH